MKIAIVSSSGDVLRQLSETLRHCLRNFEPICCDIDELRKQSLPQDTAAAFVFVADMHGLILLRSLTGLYQILPVTVISRSPDFALEAIRQGARDYLLYPVGHEELLRAIERMGLSQAWVRS